MKKAIHAVIKGRVQGVYYRASTQEKARSLGLKGWVRNLQNGDVEFIAVGEEDILDALIKWAWDGPDYAQVKDVICEFIAISHDFEDFFIKY